MQFLTLFFIIPLLFNPSPALAQNQTNNLTIRMLKDSFEPTQLVIKNGQTVKFVNEATTDRWPASNIHPTHGIYPEFDPQQAIVSGKSWEFKFEKSGRWRFHDHLNPGLTGVIIVEGNKILPEKGKIGLLTEFQNYPAYLLRFYYSVFPGQLHKQLDSLNSVEVSKDEAKLRYWLIILGGKQLMDKLVFDTDSGSKVDCHQEAHLIGRAAFEIEKEKVFQKISYSCHSGFLHGAIEAFIKDHGNQDIVETVDKLCNKFSTSFTKFECLHGIGHGFTAYTDYDIPEGLRLCKSLPDNYARRSCYGGIFMENIMVTWDKGATDHITKWVSSDPYFPCNKVDQDPLVQYECYQMQTSQMLHLSNYNFGQIVSWCLEAPKEMVPVCFRSMGRDIAGQTLRDPAKIIELCASSPPELFHECLTGAVNVVIDFWGEGLADQPHQVCKKLTSDSDKSFCYQLLGSRLKDIFTNPSKIEQVCRLSESGFYQTCIGKEPDISYAIL